MRMKHKNQDQYRASVQYKNAREDLIKLPGLDLHEYDYEERFARDIQAIREAVDTLQICPLLRGQNIIINL